MPSTISGGKAPGSAGRSVELGPQELQAVDPHAPQGVGFAGRGGLDPVAPDHRTLVPAGRKAQGLSFGGSLDLIGGPGRDLGDDGFGQTEQQHRVGAVHAADMPGEREKAPFSLHSIDSCFDTRMLI